MWMLSTTTVTHMLHVGDIIITCHVGLRRPEVGVNPASTKWSKLSHSHIYAVIQETISSCGYEMTQMDVEQLCCHTDFVSFKKYYSTEQLK